MAEVTEDQVPKKVRDLFNKGFIALERGNLDFAIDMLFHCLEMEPRFLKARKYLRAAEIKRWKGKKGSLFAGAKSKLSGFMPSRGKTKIMVKSGKGDQAVIAAEEALKNDPVNPNFVADFAEAAVMADLPEAAVQTLEVAREHHPDHPVIVERLGDCYLKVGNTNGARTAYERLSEIRPNDPAVIKKLKDALARHSMSGDGWEDTAEKGKTFQDLIKNKKEAKVLEKQAKAVTSDGDVDTLIEDAEARLEKEPDSINYYRQLGRLYARKKRFEDAIGILKKALALSPGDPELEKAVVTVQSEQYDANIAALVEDGKDEEAQALALEKAQFVFDDVQERVQRYPNDLKLRFDYGVMLFDNDYINESIQQFQMAQRSPNHRGKALYYLAMCFKQKKQYDMAVMQLESAASEMHTMNDDKKAICYELGDIYMLMDDREKAGEYYKAVYQHDIGYRDIAQKVEQVYNQ